MLTELIRLTALLPYISCLDRNRARCRREREGGRRNEKNFQFLCHSHVSSCYADDDQADDERVQRASILYSHVSRL